MKQAERDFIETSRPAAAKRELALEPIDFEQIRVEAVQATATVVATASGPRVVDAGGCSAPVTLLRLRQAVVGLKKGEEVLLYADCSGIEADLAATARVAGLVVAPGDAPGGFRIRKG